jgi:hypothetical protein
MTKEAATYLREVKTQLNAREYAVVAHEVNSGRSISWADENVENVLFSWFCLGKDTKSIAELTCIPEAVIIFTKIRYKWDVKYSAIKAQGKSPIADVTKDVAKQIFALTMMAVKKDIEEVMSGQKDPRTSNYIPKTTSQFAELCALVNEEDPIPAHTTNVQVNIANAPNHQALPPGETQPIKNKLDLLKALAVEGQEQ